jgi:endonuclease/exonuclease/phosphatase family metal-dependent hydrolase
MHVAGTAAERRPRGILEVVLDVAGIPLTLFVNHWPAGQDARVRSQRRYIARCLRELIEERLRQDPAVELIVLGDFNVSPGDEAFGAAGLAASARPDEVAAGAGAKVYNTLAHLAERVTGESVDSLPRLQAALAKHGELLGTHHTRAWPYSGPEAEWNAFDQIFVAPGLLDRVGLTWIPGSTQVLRQDFMLTAGSPRPFFEPGVDPRKQEMDRVGYSDHLPLVTRLRHVGSDEK